MQKRLKVLERKNEKEKSETDSYSCIYYYSLYTNFTIISQERLKKSTLDNMDSQAEADLQKSNQCLNMTLDKYETILYDITTDESFLSLAVTAKESADIMETDAYNMRSEFSHICNRNQGVDGIQLVLPDEKRIFYDRLSS